MSVCVYVLFVLVEKFQELPSLIGKTRISLSELSVDIYELNMQHLVCREILQTVRYEASVAVAVTCCECCYLSSHFTAAP